MPRNENTTNHALKSYWNNRSVAGTVSALNVSKIFFLSKAAMEFLECTGKDSVFNLEQYRKSNKTQELKLML